MSNEPLISGKVLVWEVNKMKARPRRGLPRRVQAGLCLLLAIILTMGVSGCMFQSSEQRVAPEMLKYMEEKYGEEFVLSDKNFMSANFAGTATSLVLHPVSHPDWNVMVNYSPNAKQPFSDNYVAFLKMDEVQAYLKPYFDEVYGPECRLFVNKPNDSAVPSYLNRDTDVQTYLEARSVMVDLYVNKDFSTSDEDAKKIWSMEALQGYEIKIRIYYFSEAGFDSQAAQEENSYTELPYLYYGNIALYRERGEYKDIRWVAAS